MVQKLRDCAESFPAARATGHGDAFAALRSAPEVEQLRLPVVWFRFHNRKTGRCQKKKDGGAAVLVLPCL